MASRAETIAHALNDQGAAFKAFLAARVGSEVEAEDLLQNGLVKALRHADELRDDTRLTPWFYQLLRNAVVDHYRSRGSARRRDEALGNLVAALGEDVAAAPNGWEPQICGCLGGVIDTLKPREAELFRRIELEGESVKDAARAMKLTASNASVMLHRARKELRKRLEAFCGACADGACLDCDCARTGETARRS
jgi:RNA polymerase sigma-70 factor (ECF subfamily)